MNNWKILDEARAKALNIKTIEYEGRSLLIADCAFVPKGMSVEKYSEWLIKDGIVTKEE